MNAKRSLLSYVAAVAAMVFLLGSCDQVFNSSEDGEEDSSPDTFISTAYFSLLDASNIPFQDGDGNSYHAGIHLTLVPSSEVSYTDFDEINVVDANGTTRWTFDASEIESAWSSGTNTVRLGYLLSSGHPDSIPLGDWSVDTTIDGTTRSKNVTVVANGDSSQTSGSVYSATKNNDPEILSLPNNPSGTLSSETLTIEFETGENRVDDAFVELYNEKSDGSYEYLGWTGYLAKETGNTVNTDGSPNTYSIDSANLYSYGSKDPSNATHGLIYLVGSASSVNGEYLAASAYINIQP